MASYTLRGYFDSSGGGLLFLGVSKKRWKSWNAQYEQNYLTALALRPLKPTHMYQEQVASVMSKSCMNNHFFLHNDVC